MVRINLPDFLNKRGFWNPILALIFSTLIVLTVVTKFNFMTVVVILILTGLMLFLVDNATGRNLVGSLPRATYPNPPHLGLDGVNIENRFDRTYI